MFMLSVYHLEKRHYFLYQYQLSLVSIHKYSGYVIFPVVYFKHFQTVAPLCQTIIFQRFLCS